MKFTRKYPGYYVATGSTTLTKHGRVTEVATTIEIVHVPEWTSPEKWYVNVWVDHGERAQLLCNGASVTLRGAKVAVQEALRRGYQFYTGGGFSCWALAPEVKGA